MIIATSWQLYQVIFTYEVPTIGFIAHMDTSPDYTGANVNPQIIENYQGNDILLNKEQNIVLSPRLF